MASNHGNEAMSMIRHFWAWMLFVWLAMGAGAAVAQTETAKSSNDGLAVMQQFNEQAEAEGGVFKLTDKEKHQVLFVMGVALLVLIGLTAYFGLAMGIGGKDVFVPHMICAGLTVTLAVAHAVTSIVWFLPF